MFFVVIIVEEGREEREVVGNCNITKIWSLYLSILGICILIENPQYLTHENDTQDEQSHP